MIAALIPARAGSVRIPDKNIQDLGGEPLVMWSISSAISSVAIERVIVSSNDDRILGLADDTEGVEPLQRPDSISDANATDWMVVQHFLECNEDQYPDPEFIVYLRPTAPLRRVAWIDDAIATFRNIRAATGLRSVHLMSESAYKCFTVTPGHRLEQVGGSALVDLANLPNHKYEQTYSANGAVDIVRPKNIEAGVLYGDHCYAYLTPWTIEIDEPKDLAYARYLAERGNHAGLSIEVA